MDREEAQAFERGLDAWIAQLELTASSNDPLWRRAFELKQCAENLRVGNPRMELLHQKLSNVLNLLVGQSAERRKFITELRTAKSSI